MINVLQYNPTSNSRIKAPQKREIVAFKHQLEQAGLEVTMRVSHGREINAACGQLANTYNKWRIVKLSATPLRNRPHMVFCSQGTSWGAGSTHGTSVGCNPLAYP